MLFQPMFVTNKDQIATNNKKKQNKKRNAIWMQKFFVKLIAKVSEKTPKNKSSSSVQGPSKQPYKKQALS